MFIYIYIYMCMRSASVLMGFLMTLTTFIWGLDYNYTHHTFIKEKHDFQQTTLNFTPLTM